MTYNDAQWVYRYLDSVRAYHDKAVRWGAEIDREYTIARAEVTRIMGHRHIGWASDIQRESQG